MTVTASPTITDSVNQSFFIEALGGAQHPISYLDRFPDAVYTKSVDSLLVKFMYALLGPVGIGSLRQEYLEARLQIEEAGLQTADIDALYTNAFAFARLADETYQVDASADLLPAAQRSQILAQDAAFRNRASDFLKGARAGGTPLGIQMVARSGLNRPVDVIENYKALYDRYADQPLGLPYVGQTLSTNEVIVIPRQIAPQSAVQTLTLFGDPITGYFTLTFPRGQSWVAVPVTTTAGSTTVTASNPGLLPAGVFVTLTSLPGSSTTNLDPTQAGWNYATLFTQSTGPTGTGTQVTLANPAPVSGNVIALVGIGQTVPIPYNATAGQVQTALAGLPVIGNNVVCSGGPLPSSPVQIQFAGSLSDQSVPYLAVNVAADKAVGIGTVGSGYAQMADVSNNTLTITGTVTMDTVGISGDGQSTTIAPADEHTMLLALDQTKPMTTVVTSTDGPGTTIRQRVNTAYTGSARVEVVRYATGRASVNWPPLDSTHWVEAGVEHEAPRPLGSDSQHYQGFHNVSSALAYTEAALLDPAYPQGTAGLVPVYWNSLIGLFGQAQQALIPALAAYTDATAQYLPGNAINAVPEPLVISNLGNQGVINGIYPVDYYSLPGVQPPTRTTLWASMERTAGTDYLEIDLGAVQAVNYLYFEAARVPYQIDVAYDVLDQAPARSFHPVTLSATNQSITSLTYDTTVTNMWETVETFFNNSFGGMIYTRFVRIAFTRTPIGTPFAPVGQPAVPYSIEVRNLRIGRNVSTPNGGVTRFVKGS